MNPRRFDVFLVSLDPAGGAEIRKTRPCVVVSPDEANARLSTAVVVPITSAIRSYPSRVDLVFRDREGQAAIDQIRAVDNVRMMRRLGRIDPDAARRLTERLANYFS